MSPPNAFTDVAGTQTLELAAVELSARFLGPSAFTGASLLSVLLKGVRNSG